MHNLTVEVELEMMLGILNDVAVAMAYLYRVLPPIPHQQLSSGRVGDKSIIVPDLASFLAWLCVRIELHVKPCMSICVCNSKELPVEPCLLSTQQGKWSSIASELQARFCD